MASEEITRCSSCLEEDPEFIRPYVCSRCDGRNNPDEIDGNRCPECNIFMSREEEAVCSVCLEPESEIETVMVDREKEAAETAERRVRMKADNDKFLEEFREKQDRQRAFWAEHAREMTGIPDYHTRDLEATDPEDGPAWFEQTFGIADGAAINQAQAQRIALRLYVYRSVLYAIATGNNKDAREAARHVLDSEGTADVE